MSKKSIRYSEEFKQQIVELYQAGSSVSYLSNEYGITTVSIYKWIKELANEVEDSEDASPTKEYDKMKKRIAELEIENEILKKATAIFARKQ